MRRHTKRGVLVAASLLAGFAPAGAQTFTTYHCRDGSEFVVAFFEADKRAHVQLDGKALTLPKRLSLGGRRYAKGDITLRIAKGRTTLKRGRHSTECSVD